MHAPGTSWKPTQRLLSDLMEQGLLEVRIASGLSKRRYIITERGVNILDYFEKANEILPKDVYSARAIPS